MYKAERSSIGKYEIKGGSGQSIVKIQMPRKVWATDNAPLNPAVTAMGLNDRPQFEFQNRTLEARRALLTNNALVNFFRIWIEDEGNLLIETSLNGAFKPSIIRYKGSEYSLVRHSFFSFRFTLEKDGQVLAGFEDTTPFLTFSSHRTFGISHKQELDDVLLGFAFFLSVMAFFKS